MCTHTNINFSMQVGGEFIMLPDSSFTVASDNAEKFGYPDDVLEDEASVLDAVIEAHMKRLGSDFTSENCRNILELSGSNWLAKAFGESAHYSCFAINGQYMRDEDSKYTNAGYRGLAFNQAALKDQDRVEVFIFKDSGGMDYYTYFLHEGKHKSKLRLAPGEKASLSIEGLMFGYGGPMTDEDREKHHLVSRVAGAQIVTVDTETGEMTPIQGAMADDEGNFTLAFEEPGTYHVSTTGGTCRYTSNLTHPWLEVLVA